VRFDQQLGGDVSLRQLFGAFGTFTVDGGIKRNWSTVAGVSPIWIPEWDYGVGMKWVRGWSLR
jgi:hypothetical protein